MSANKALIKKELQKDENNGFDFHYQKLSNKFIDWIFRHYYIHEMCENFYDSEPIFDEEEFNMYMDYQNKHQLKDFSFSKKLHTNQELKTAYDKIVRMYKEYEDTRLKFCCWQEPYFKGNWGMSQIQVDSFGKSVLKNIRKFPQSIKDRIYIAKKEDQIRIYFYGRDFWKKDYWFIFLKRKKRL